jgi:hypothetical protein
MRKFPAPSCATCRRAFEGKMATREEHISKYELFWSLAQKHYREGATRSCA